MDSTSRARRDADAMPAQWPIVVQLDQTIRAEEANMNVNYSVEGAKYGISFGTALAIAISYTNNHSILWAIIHGFFSWLYVIYFALFK
jgi:hypothetical protein